MKIPKKKGRPRKKQARPDDSPLSLDERLCDARVEYRRARAELAKYPSAFAVESFHRAQTLLTKLEKQKQQEPSTKPVMSRQR